MIKCRRRVHIPNISGGYTLDVTQHLERYTPREVIVYKEIHEHDVIIELLS